MPEAPIEADRTEGSAIGPDNSVRRPWFRFWQIVLVLFVATYYKDLRRRLAQDFQYRMGVWPHSHVFSNHLFGSIYTVCQCWAWQLWSCTVGILISIIAICVATRTQYFVPAVVVLTCAWLPHVLIWGIMLYYVLVVRLEVSIAWEVERLETQIRRVERRTTRRHLRERQAQVLMDLARSRGDDILQRLEEGRTPIETFEMYQQPIAPRAAHAAQAPNDTHVRDRVVRNPLNNGVVVVVTEIVVEPAGVETNEV